MEDRQASVYSEVIQMKTIRLIHPARATCTVLTVALIMVATASPARGQATGVRRQFMGMHNLKDGGPDILTGFHWTKNLTGSTGYVFDWVFDYDPNSPLNWVGEAIQMDLVPCIRVQDGAGGDDPNPGYPGLVAGLICEWKLANPQYADRLVYMALWNEPGDPRDYVPMDVFADYMVAAHTNVHNAEAAAAAINPDIAGTFKTMTPGQNNPYSWTEALQHNPACAFAFDVWGSHPYPESYPPWYNMHEGHGFVTKHKMIDGHLRDLDVFAQYGRRGFPVMITETAYGDHLGISYEGYPKTTRQMAADYNVEAFGTWWYKWPETLAVHPYILSNVSWNAFAWANGSNLDNEHLDGTPGSDGIYEPSDPFPQYTAVRNWQIATVNAGLLAPAQLSPYRGPVGVIRGTVTRADTGDPVKYANVYTDGYEFGGPSLYDGQYVVRDVPTGTYTLTVEKRGHLTSSQQITVNQGQETVTNFSLTYIGKVPKGFYFVDCGAPGLPCHGSCPDCSLYADFHGQTFVTPDDVGFIKFAAAKPNVGGVTLKFTIIEGNSPSGPEVGSFNSYYLEPTLGGEMIGGEAPGDGIPIQPDTTYFLKIERTDGQGIYLYTSNENPYPDGCRWVGDRQETGWDIYGVIRGNTVEVTTVTGSITGHVEDESSNPIADANVATSPGGQGATTDAGGNYTIADVPIGTTSVIASKLGYSTETETGVLVQENQTTVVNFVLEPGPTTGSISGNISDATYGGPLAGALVETTTGGHSDTTDAGGNYVLDDVAPGTYTVQASKTGYLTEQQTNIQVVAGQISTVNLALSEETPFGGLINGDFEGGAFDDPDVDHRTATGWHQFISTGSSKSNVVWYGSGAHSEDYVQDFYESDWTAGIYQEVGGAVAGNEYGGSVWVKADSDSITFWIGIDPSGGTDPNAAGIEWSAPVDQVDGGWSQISVSAVATSSTITLFIKAQNPDPGYGEAHMDDAELVDNGPGVDPPTIVWGDDSQPSDGDVDQEDFGAFQVCLTGPNNPIPPTATTAGGHLCTMFDADDDNDVDLSDFGMFQRCYSGPGATSSCEMAAPYPPVP